jgi:Flp pilus assembly protein TadD
MQRLRQRDARREQASPDPGTRERGLREEGAMLWQAGLYVEAARVLERGLVIDPEDAKARHFAALSYFAAGQTEEARAHLRALLRVQARLTPVQRGRMAYLTRALGAPEP